MYTVRFSMVDYREKKTDLFICSISSHSGKANK